MEALFSLPSDTRGLGLTLIALTSAFLSLAAARQRQFRTLINWIGLLVIGSAFIRAMFVPDRDVFELPVALGQVEWATVSGLSFFITAAFVVLCQSSLHATDRPIRYREGLAFAILSALWLGFSVFSVFTTIIALQLVSVVFLRLVNVAPGYQQRALLPASLVSLLVLFAAQVLGAGILAAQLETLDLSILYHGGDVVETIPIQIGGAILIAALSGQVIWLLFVYFSGIRAGLSPATHMFAAGLILPGGTFLAARLMPLAEHIGGEIQLTIWVALIGLGTWGGYILRALSGYTSIQALVGYIVGTSCLLMLFYGSLGQFSSRHAILGLFVCLSLGGAALGLLGRILDVSFAREGAVPGSVITAACGLTGLAVAGAPPFVGFWAHWSFARDMIGAGPFEAVVFVSLLVFGLIVGWAFRWVPVWQAALVGLANAKRPAALRPLHLGIASFLLALLVLFSATPDMIMAGAGRDGVSAGMGAASTEGRH